MDFLSENMYYLQYFVIIINIDSMSSEPALTPQNVTALLPGGDGESVYDEPIFWSGTSVIS